MFRVIGIFIGLFLGAPLMPFGSLLGAYAGYQLGKYVDRSIFGVTRRRSNYQRDQEAYRKFYEQFFHNFHQNNAYSGYTGGSSNSYNNYQNPGATDQCYSNLGCSRTDSTDTLKKSYRKMVSQYHPDRMAARKLSESEMKTAESRFRTIQDSYERIRKERGF